MILSEPYNISMTKGSDKLLIRSVCFVTAFLLLACAVVAVSAAVYQPAVINEAEPITQEAEPAAPTVDPAPEETAEATAAQPTEAPKHAITKVKEHSSSEDGYTPRMTAPDADNTCYYSDENPFYAADYGMPNCTCYAWGRAYEITGETPQLSPYDACTWYDYNQQNDIYDYGDTPKQGAIACWTYSDGGSGHVAVVEEVEKDTVLLSNSAYGGTNFYLDTVPSDNPSSGRNGWIFQGYIYVDKEE